jgi:oligoendopeptidase F
MIQTISTTRWSLEDLLPEPVEDSLATALAELEELTTSFEQAREMLADGVSQSEVLGMLGHYESILRLAYRLYGYAQLYFTEDTKNPAALNLRDRVNQVVTDVDNRTLFFTLWLKSLPDEAADRLKPEMGDYRHYIDTVRKFKPHTLSESEEQIINLKSTNGIDALVNLYDMITSGFEFIVEVDSEKRTLTRDQVGALYRHPSAGVRAAAYQELFRVYGENSAVLAQMYNHRVRDWNDEQLTLRKYDSPISTRNLINDIPDEAVEALLDVCARNNSVFQRYFQLKAGWLGMDKLRRYDIYAPLAKADKTYDFSHAYELVMDGLAHFSPEVAGLAQRVFAENHIDSEVRPGKRGGAFCYSVVPGLTPWVMLNYTGQARDVSTLAHELGHAIHGMLAAEHSQLTFHPSLPLAETASVFSEMLLTDRLLEEETDTAVLRDILAGAIDDAYATVQRQSYFTLFEREAHGRIMGGERIEDICARYLDNLKAQFGDAVAVSEDFRWEWIAIPHIYHTPFYTYAYSFGQLLVLSLYQQYREQGEGFIPRYLKLLSYGGSEEPARVLREAGFDITSTDFWQGGYDVLSGMVDRLAAL